MEFSIKSIKERAKIGKKNSKIRDLKKAESMIESAADDGKFVIILRNSDFADLSENGEFILSHLEKIGFYVRAESTWGLTQKLWVYWGDKK